MLTTPAARGEHWTKIFQKSPSSSSDHRGRPQYEPPSKPASWIARWLLGVYLVLQIIVGLYLVIRLWPAALDFAQRANNAQGPAKPLITIFGVRWSPSVEELFVVLVCVAAALGSAVVSARSMMHFATAKLSHLRAPSWVRRARPASGGKLASGGTLLARPDQFLGQFGDELLHEG